MEDTAGVRKKCLLLPQPCQMVPAILQGGDSVAQWSEPKS